MDAFGALLSARLRVQAATSQLFRIEEPQFGLHKYHLLRHALGSTGAGGVFISEQFLPGGPPTILPAAFSI